MTELQDPSKTSDICIYHVTAEGACGTDLSSAIQHLHAVLSERTPHQQTSQSTENKHIKFREIASLDSLREELSADASNAIQICLISSQIIEIQTKAAIESLRIVSPSRELIVFIQGALDEHQCFVEAMRCGADDFLPDGLAPELLAEKLYAQINICHVRKQLEEQHQAISENHQHILHEQEMAKQVFDKVAHSLVDMDNLRHWLSPIAIFNGDVLLSTPTPSGGMLLLMGDFTGHGLGAAIGAIPLASTFYGMAHKGFTLQDIVKELNSKLHEILPVGVFCCATVMQIDFAEGVAEIWNAGLPDALILKRDEQQIVPVPSTALALGILSSQAFNFESTRYKLNEGDSLYFLTDGISETENEAGEQYGEQRLRETLNNTLIAGQRDSFDILKQNVLDFIGGNARADDISLVEVTVVSASEFSGYYEQDNKLGFCQPVSWKLDYEFRPQSLKHQDPVPLILHALLEEPGLRQFSGRLFSIISELFNNALDHGLLELPSELKHEAMGFAHYYEERIKRLADLQSGSVKFSLDYTADENGGELIVDVIDSGTGFDFRQKRENTGEPALHGRGLALVRSICESVDFLDRGNHVRVVYRWPDSVPAADHQLEQKSA